MTTTLIAVTWTEAGPGIAGIVAGCALLGVLVWQAFSTLRARSGGAHEDAYRKLAERAADAQDRTAASLQRAATELSALRARIEALERLLEEVE